MSKYLLFITTLFTVNSTVAQTIWNGAFIIFEKESQSDWELPDNQDRITDDVWITRKSTMGIFNIRQEDAYVNDVSPINTAWAFGTTAQIADLNFLPWELAIGSNPIGALNDDMVLHLLQDDIYIDIKFLSWQAGGGGGGFSYQRATANVLSTNDADAYAQVSLFPNPAGTWLQLSGIIKPVEIIVLDAQGRTISTHQLLPNARIDISAFPKGVYFVMVERTRVLKLIKV